MKSISVIIPTFNGRELLDKYLPAVMQACENYGGEWEVIVVDDGSSEQNFPFKANNVKYIRREQNGGFSRAMNMGIREAMREIVIALNNDVRVTLNFIEPLLKYFNDSSVFSVKPKSILPDGSNESIKAIKINKGMAESVVISLDSLPVRQAVRFRGNDIVELPYSCAGSVAYDKKKLLELGGFDEIYSPFYWEDFDLGYRAVKRSWKNIYEPQSVVYHEHGATISKIAKDTPLQKEGITKQAIFIRNREIFYWKNISDFKLNIIALLFFPVRFLKAVILGKKDIYQGLIEFLKILPMVVKKRSGEQNSSKLKDKEIIKKFSL